MIDFSKITFKVNIVSLIKIWRWMKRNKLSDIFSHGTKIKEDASGD
jgi:hypothetical protein